MSGTPVIHGVGIVVFNDDRVLMVKRANPPGAGRWSIPGGRIEPNEHEEDAARRELYEETGLHAGALIKIETVNLRVDDVTFALHDFLAVSTKGRLKPGDDALDARFFTPEALALMPIWIKTMDIIFAARRHWVVSKKGDAPQKTG